MTIEDIERINAASEDTVLTLPSYDVQPTRELVPETPEHMEGIRNRIIRLEGLLEKAARYVPRYDEDGHKLPLKQVIESELGVKT
jgi:hypothetical protein